MKHMMRTLAIGAIVFVSRLCYGEDVSLVPSKDSPKETMLAISRACEKLDSELLIGFYETTTPLEKAYARAVCDYDVAGTKIQLAIRKKWGRKQEGSFLNGIYQNTDDEVRAADFKIEDDRATVKFKGDSEPSVSLIRVDGVWKYNVHADLHGPSDDEIKGLTKRDQSIAKKIAPFAAKVEKGEYKDPDSVTADVRRIIDADQNSNP